MHQRDLFSVVYEQPSDEEITQVLARAVAAAGRLPRSMELHLNQMSAEHLLTELRLADLEIVRRRAPSP
jgi:hypothetical protein